MEYYQKHITRCFELISQKLSIGAFDSWNTHDFKVLSESIHKKTGTLLSVSTLKRLSGKVKYDSIPNIATLNALAQYVGSKDWRTFVQNEKNSVASTKKEQKTKSRRIDSQVLFLLVLTACIIIFFISKRTVTTYNPNDFAFDGKSVTTGLPNSVVFNYDASAAKDGAKIEIQQDWDERKRIEINRNDSVATSIYYHPGFFKSKLVVDDTIVKEKNVLIPTVDWLGIVETDSLPIYLDKEDYYIENGLAINPETLKKYGIDPIKERTAVGLYKVKDFGELFTDDFELTATLKNNFRSGQSLCQATQVLIMHEDGPISIVLTDKGCISDISLYAFDKTIDGKKTDLSGFGVDFINFIELKFISKNQELEIFVDDKQIFSFNIPSIPSKIIGLSIRFEGGGSIKEIELKDSRRIVYNLNFKVTEPHK